MKLGELSITAKVRDSAKDTVFLVAGHDHYVKGATTLISDLNVVYMCYDSIEPENPLESRALNGNNEYPVSNVHQWLNSDKPRWFTPMHEYDKPPEMAMLPHYGYELPVEAMTNDEAPGFLDGFNKTFVRAIKPVEVPCAITTAEGEVHIENQRLKVFIPSTSEIGYNTGTEVELGAKLPIFNDMRYIFCDFNYWVRTPAFEDWEDIIMPPHMRFDKVSGICRDVGGRYGSVHYLGFTNRKACDISGVRPILNLDSKLELEPEPDENGVYIIKPGSRYCNVPKTMKYNPNCICFAKTCPSFGFCAECVHHHTPNHPQSCRRSEEHHDVTGCGTHTFPGHEDSSLKF